MIDISHYNKTIISFFFLIVIHSLNAQDETTQGLDTSLLEATVVTCCTEDSAIINLNELSSELFIHDNVMSSLQGKDAGLYVFANSFTPGASSRMTFRGMRSFYGSNQPTLIWNGIALDNAEWNNGVSGTDQSNRLMDIDPTAFHTTDMIKSMVHRAGYGIWGGDGIINTASKERATGPAQVSFLSSIGVNQVSQLPRRQNTYAPGFTQNGISTYLGPETFYRSSWGPPINELIYDGDPTYPYDNNGQLFLPFGQTGQMANIYNPYDFFQNGLNFYNSINFKGGTDRISYSTSASTHNEEGIIPTNSQNKYFLNPNIFVKLTDKWKIDIHSIISSSTTYRTLKGSNLQGIALSVFRTPSTFDNSNMLDDPVNNIASYEIPGGLHRSASAGIYANPYWSINNNEHYNKLRRQVAVLKNTYQIKSYLNLEATIGTDQYRDQRLGGSAANVASTFSGSSYHHTINYRSTTADIKLNYNDTLTEKINWESSIGFNWFDSKSKFDVRDGANSITETDSFSIHQLRYGNYLNVKLNYADWLSFTGTARMDHSNKFGAASNGFISYGIGVGMSVSDYLNSQNSNLDPLPFDFSVNASYGKFGNLYSGRQDYGKYAATRITGDAWISSAEPNNAELSSITRSTQINSEVVEGYDLMFHFVYPEKRSSMSLTLYSEKSSSLIAVDNISTSSGFSSFENNFGAITNTGIEINLSSLILDRDKLKWQTGIGFLTNSNTVSEIAPFSDQLSLGGFTVTQSVVSEGHPYGAFYGRQFARENGQVLIGSDGFPFDDFQFAILGDPNPDWIMSFLNDLKVGNNIEIAALIEWKKGGDNYCGTCGTLDYFGLSERSGEERGGTFVFDGITTSGETNTQEVELAPSDGSSSQYYRVRYGFGGLTEMNIHDASWLKLRRLSTSYDLSSYLTPSFQGSLKMGIYLENILLFTKYPGIDPETNLSGNSGVLGFDYYNNPSNKTYGAFIKVQF